MNHIIIQFTKSSNDPVIVKITESVSLKFYSDFSYEIRSFGSIVTDSVSCTTLGKAQACINRSLRWLAHSKVTLKEI